VLRVVAISGREAIDGQIPQDKLFPLPMREEAQVEDVDVAASEGNEGEKPAVAALRDEARQEVAAVKESHGEGPKEMSVALPTHSDPEVSEEGKQGAFLDLIAKLFPTSYLQVAVLTAAFGIVLVCTTLPQGLAYGRFQTRALDCYHNKSYFKLDPNVTETHEHCVVFSYPYRLVEPSAATRVIPWCAYLTHQLGQWFLLRASQLARDRGEIAWPKAGTPALPADGELSAEERRAAFRPNKYARYMFFLNLSMVLLKFFQAQIFYDGLASDVPEFSALYSVALWVLFAMIIEMPRRGLAPLSF